MVLPELPTSPIASPMPIFCFASNQDAAPLQVRQFDLQAVAQQHHVISGRILSVRFRRRQIRKAVQCARDCPVAGTHHGPAEDFVAMKVTGKDPRGTEAYGADGGDVGRVALRRVTGMLVEKRNAATLADNEPTVAQWEGEVPRLARRHHAAHDIDQGRTEGGQRERRWKPLPQERPSVGRHYGAPGMEDERS